MESQSIEESRLTHMLSVQSHQIERVFSHHQVPATVSGGKVSRHTLSFDLQAYFSGGLDRFRGLFEDLKSALGGRQPILANQAGRWQLRIARPAEPAVSLLRLLATCPDLPPATAAIGLATGKQPVLLPFGPRQIHHVMIAGDSGAGKTNLLRTIAVGLARINRQSQIQLIVLNPLGGNEQVERPLRPLSWLPHMMTDPADDIESCREILRFLVAEMEYRREQRLRQPQIITIVDHLVTLLEQSREAGQDIIRLLQHGPRAGIHLVMATRRPESPLIDTPYRANLSLRLVGRFDQSLGQRRVAGVSVDPATTLYGQGDFLALNGEAVTYFQAAAIDDYDLHLTLTELLKRDRPRLLARPYNPRLSLETEKDQLLIDQTQSFSVRNGSVEISRKKESA